MIYFLCPDDNNPVGGIKYLYKHVDILNKNGFEASVLHKNVGFRCTWFENNTKIYFWNHVTLNRDDYLVVPETYGPNLHEKAKGVKKVIFNQNAFYTFNNYSLSKDELQSAYLDKEVVAVFCTSEYTAQLVKKVFPRQNVFRGHYFIDSSLFRYNPHKEKMISFMTRKIPGDVISVINILKFRNILGEFEVKEINNVCERDVAVLFQRSMLFLSFSDREGFGLPPIEAMSCGCVVIGYHGIGGREYFKPEFSYPVESSDILAFADCVEQCIKEYKDALGVFVEKGKRASAYVNRIYSLERAEDGIVSFWKNLMTGQNSPSFQGRG